ncbi:MAG TPA: 4'-phosphopantetheinyl transferase superfamily protein [Solirubrobacterales bacterium]|nr:4'-phosphopantetheinyl transferase superfamily protein [Solirubrobacterales bacterium]
MAIHATGAVSSGVHVWRVDLDAPPALDPAALPPAERERAARLLLPLDRARWLAGRVALRRVLARYLDEKPERIELVLEGRGKPVLARRHPPIRFNLSHSGGLALVAVTAGREVGVDVEAKESGRDFLRLAELGLDAEAATAVRDAPPEERGDVFYAAWVRHEAAVKCAGSGLGSPAPKRPMSIRDVDLGEGHAAAVAVADSLHVEDQNDAGANAMLPLCQTRPPGKVARLGAGKALALLSSVAASSAHTSSQS